MKLLASSALVFAFCVASAFELPPWAYKDMQKKAPEFVNIRVTGVKKSVKDLKDKIETSVTATAVVEKVIRSKRGLKPKQTITIRYVHTEHKEGWAGPSPVPLLKKGERVPAYLTKHVQGFYAPAAGGYSFETVKE